MHTARIAGLQQRPSSVIGLTYDDLRYQGSVLYCWAISTGDNGVVCGASRDFGSSPHYTRPPDPSEKILETIFRRALPVPTVLYTLVQIAAELRTGPGKVRSFTSWL